ncbi:MAG: TetR/AcrR family transcriptional regulator [Oscillospiraceae bacterium]|nr:TetR/AcrR family transcriptional regulator [Oscillospiraceae bacterium]
MENFFNLRAEKQAHIIDAALSVFGRNGYKKTSVADIAEKAGIAKGMVNYYFGSKKNLYLHLYGFCEKKLVTELENRFDAVVTDFFDKIKMMSDIKIALLKQHTAILSFMMSFYHEKDDEVYSEIKIMLDKGTKVRDKWIFSETDTSKFKESVDIKLLDKLFVWAAEGFISGLEKDMNIEKVEEFTNEFYQCLDLMKNHFYKEEL